MDSTINEVTISEIRKSATWREAALVVSIVLSQINILTSIAGSPTDLGTMSFIVLSFLFVFGNSLLLSDFFQYKTSRLSPFGQSGIMIIQVALVAVLVAFIQVCIELSKCLDVPSDIISRYRNCQTQSGQNCILLSSDKLVGVGNQICGNVTSDSYVSMQGFRIFFLIATAILNLFIVHKTWNLQKIMFKAQQSISLQVSKEVTSSTKIIVSEVLVFRTAVAISVFDIVKLCIIGVSEFASLPISHIISFAGVCCLFSAIFQCNFFKPVDSKNESQQQFLSTGVRVISYVLSVQALCLCIIGYIFLIVELSNCSDVSESQAKLSSCQDSQAYSDFACMTQIQSRIVSPATGMCYNVILAPVLGPIWITINFLVLTMFFATGCITLEKSEGWKIVTHIFNSLFV